MTSRTQNAEEIVSRVRNTFESGKTKPIQFRIKQLQAMKRMLEENKDEIVKALEQDLHKNKYEALLTEVNFIINDIKMILMNLHDWMKPVKPSKDFANILDSVYILSDPYGVALVMGAWNYPLQLTLSPVCGALAGEIPSEHAPAVAKLIADYVPEYLDEDAVQVYLGGIPETAELLKQRFDYIFFTGSTAVGRIVHAAANKYLTPTTLELGGKSPVYLDSTADVEVAAKRILWGKFINAGQTCVAPDYLLCSKEVQSKFIPVAKKIIKQFFGDEPKASADFGRIINDANFARISGLLKGCTVAVGGTDGRL
ncbi:hypothetical protein NQ318_002976 [Aromia moschata]|uniref:Aldehyde dehydrogenase domain-containing protein n=1 Tax=Aromia moschata TaxID=1265417 RepID=A0AAV8YS94_9CUCU|nr:hypothetical protein NQ318_002976 [Aromia moschata]